MADVTFEDLPARPVLSMRAPVRLGEIGEVIGTLMPTLMKTAGDHVAGAVVARYHGWANSAGTLELAVPVSEALPGQGDVLASELPACRAAIVEHVGPYDGLAEAWNRLNAWLDAEGHARGAAPWEEYVSDCNVTPPAEVVTRIVCPLA